MRKRSLGYIVLVLVIGSVVGSVIGDALGAVLPPGVVREFFLRHLVDFSFGPATIDLSVVSFTLGLAININIVGVLGIILIAYILRWMD